MVAVVEAFIITVCVIIYCYLKSTMSTNFRMEIMRSNGCDQEVNTTDQEVNTAEQEVNTTDQEVSTTINESYSGLPSNDQNSDSVSSINLNVDGIDGKLQCLRLSSWYFDEITWSHYQYLIVQ